MEEDISKDDRFSVIYTDPRFKKVPKYERKVKIDKRFQSMFTDKNFQVKYTIDKRGRPFCRSTTDDYKKFYDLPSDEETDDKSTVHDEQNDDNSDHENLNVSDLHDSNDDASVESHGNENSSTDEEKVNSGDNLERNDVKKAKKLISDKLLEKLKDINVDYARGEHNLFSESSSDEPESEESDSDEFEHKWGEFDNDAESADQITSRLAVCNMDWDRIRAEDLMMLFHSFLPPNGIIHSLAIYPSEYGSKRMKEEELNGPTELVNRDDDQSSIESDSDAEEAAEGNTYHRECLRQYQLNRLKYYYAVITFDSPETADIIYKECDNLEYESSSTRLDLRYVPDDTVFDQEPKEVCNRLPDLTKYKPRYFTTTALQQAKVELTWDETDPGRQEFVQNISEALKSGDVDDADLTNYVALSSSGEEEAGDDGNSEEKEDKGNENSEKEKEDPISAYRNLLLEIERKEQDKDDVQLEISWGPDSENHHQRKQQSMTANDGGEDGKTDLTPYQKLVEKDQEKRRQRKKFKKLKKKHSGSNQEEAENGGSSDEIHFGSENDDINSSSKVDENHDTIVDGSDEADSDGDVKKQAELELLLMDNDGDNQKSHFSFKKIKEKEAKRRRRKRKEKLTNVSAQQTEDVQVDVHDKRFEAIYSSHLFNIDPANPHFHRTKGMESFINEKQKRKAENVKGNESTIGTEVAAKLPKTDDNITPELSSLVKSVKKKTQLLLPRKQKR